MLALELSRGVQGHTCQCRSLSTYIEKCFGRFQRLVSRCNGNIHAPAQPRSPMVPHPHLCCSAGLVAQRVVVPRAV